MQCAGSSIRRTKTVALILISLFHIPVGPPFSHRQPGSPVRSYFVPTTDTEAFAPPTRLLAADQITRARVSEAYGKLPLRFEANAGQADPQIKFLSRGSGYNLFLTPTEAVFALHKEEVPIKARSRTTATNQRSIVRMRLIGANPALQVEGEDALPGKSNYLIGNDPAKWRRNVTSYTKVRYRSVYPGIDMIYYGNQQQLEYDFVVAKGGDPEAVKLSFDGVQRMDVDAQGDLVLHTEGGQVRQRKPLTYQEVNGRRQEIASRYVLIGERQVGFELGAYDRARPLVIDPVLVYSTYLGGLGIDGANRIAVDAEGNVYVAGSTNSVDFPTVNPIQPVFGGTPPFTDAFVAKLNREGSALIYSTYLGGSRLDQASDIAVDENGNAYVSGSTTSPDFPTMNPFQPALAGFVQDAFIAKLDATGSAFVYSTYLGGTGRDQSLALAIDKECNVYITGETSSADFPTSDPLQPSLAGFSDAFIVKFNAAGSALIYSTYLGGSNNDSSRSITIGCQGNVYLVGSTNSVNFPTANPLQPGMGDSTPPPFSNGGDAFVAKLATDGRSFVFSTYFGGDELDQATAIAVDPFDNAYVTGYTRSTNLPTVRPIQPTLASTIDAFVAKFNPSGSAIHYSTYLGGSADELAVGIAVDAQGNAYITGQTRSTDFPTLDAMQPMPDSLAPADGFVSRLNTDGSGFVHSTYLGGSNPDTCSDITLDARGDIYVAGSTNSVDLPTSREAFQKAFAGEADALIIKIHERRNRRHDGERTK